MTERTVWGCDMAKGVVYVALRGRAVSGIYAIIGMGFARGGREGMA